jgi:hypothetical protein
MKSVAAIFIGLSLMTQDNFKTSAIQVISKSVLMVTRNTVFARVICALFFYFGR